MRETDLVELSVGVGRWARNHFAPFTSNQCIRHWNHRIYRYSPPLVLKFAPDLDILLSSDAPPPFTQIYVLALGK